MNEFKEDELTIEDLHAIRRGIEDIKSGRIITLDKYERDRIED